MAEPLTVKEQVMAALAARMSGLVHPSGSAVFRGVTRYDVAHGVTVNRPHCCVLRGPERTDPRAQDDDIEGLLLTAYVKVYCEDRADVDSRLNQLHGIVYDDLQDQTLGGLCGYVRYKGDVPFTAKLLDLPSGTQVMSYEVFYAHPRGQSAVSFD